MIGLLTTQGSMVVDALVACGGLPLAAVDTPSLGLPPYFCPYGLPVVSSGEMVLVTSGWLHRLEGQGIDPVEGGLGPLRQRFRRVIGLPDGADPKSAVATFKDGVLEIAVHLNAEMTPEMRRLDIG